MKKDLEWAAKIVMQLANVQVQKKLVDAFKNYEQNKMWVLGVIQKAAPAANAMSNPYYREALEILQQNGIDINIYDTNR